MPENAIKLDDISFDSHNTNQIPDLNSEGSGRHDIDGNYQRYHVASGEPDSIESPIVNIDPDQSIINSEDTIDSTIIGTGPRTSSATVVESPLQCHVTRMSVLGWLARGLPSEARSKLRWLLKNLKETFPELYDEIIVDSQEFTRAELLAWLDIVGDIVSPEGTDINALMAELD